MVPANNTTMEVELAAWLPPGSTVTTVKIPRGPGLLTKETLPAYRDSAIALARQHFADGGFDLIAYGCTAAGFLSGPAGDAELAAMLTEATGLAGGHHRARHGARAAAREGEAHRRGHALPRRGERAARRRSSPTAASASSASIRSGRRMSPRSAASPPNRCAIWRARPWGRIATRCSSAARNCRRTRSSPACEAEFARPAWSSIRATAWDAGRLPVAA